MAIVIGISALLQKRAESKRLAQCLVKDPAPEVEVFEYKDNLYMRDEFVKLEAQSLLEGRESGPRERHLEALRKGIESWEEELTRTKYPGYVQAKIDALELACKEL